MKKIFIIIGLMFSLNLNAQWTKKTVENDFDEPYKICYTETNNDGWLKLENIDGVISFYIKGGYYCEENPQVDLAFIVNGISKKYIIDGNTSSSNEIVWLIDDLVKNDVFEDFKNCSVLKIRINDSICESEIYSFNMSGSTSAINFMLNK